MKRATDRFDSEKLINAGFKVKPDLMWNLKSDNRYPMIVLERYNPKTRLYVAPAFSLALLIDAVPKFTTYGWFAIKYNLRADAYLVGYVDDEDNFTKVYGLANLIDAIVYLLLWTLENPEVVKEGEKYLGKEASNEN